MIGKTLGHYEVLDLLGKGGMGEVYRARDKRLGRDVAIKVLPEAIAQNPEVQSRFQREATTISSLNHPHICVLHDVGQEGDVRFLVMELVDGITLAQRLRKGPLPIDEVLRVGSQIADALDRAHRAGVIHRDLKPGNVMLTKSGAKLMDFGLARVTAAEQERNDVTVAESPASPTVAHPLTAEGAIVGTFQYMAPEQLEGREVDQRSDLWALGCVLYEMATGRRAFEGKTQASLIGSIMHQQPEPVSQVADLSPLELDRLVQACLTKDPEDRVQSAHDIKLQLDWIAEGASSSATGIAPLPRSSRARRGWLVPLVVGVLAAAAGAGIASQLLGRATAPATGDEPQRFQLGQWNLRTQATPVFSPDGNSVVFAVQEERTTRLYRRDLESFGETSIHGTEDARAPFFSPDGKWIGFLTQDGVKKIPAGGGIVQTVTSIPGCSSGEWGSNGMIYLTFRGGGESGDIAVIRVPENGGAPEIVGRLDTEDGENEAWLPELLPDGKSVLVSTVGGSTSPWRIVLLGPDGSRRVLLDDAFLGRFSPTGHLVYQESSSQSVFAVPFDPDRLEITGGAFVLTEPVDGNYCFDISRDGKLVYVIVPSAEDGAQIMWIDRDGKSEVAATMEASWAQPRISPDGQRVLLRKVGSLCELWMLDVARGSLSRVVQGDDNHDPVWSADGRSIAYHRMNSGEVVTMTVVGSRAVKVLDGVPHHAVPHWWSRNPEYLALSVLSPGNLIDIYLHDMATDEARTFLATAANEDEPVISPDGRWVAYVSDETGSSEVLVRRLPDDGTAWQVSSDGGKSPLWSRNGSELYYVRGSQMMVVPVETEPDFSPGTPAVLFEGGFSITRPRDFDVGPDGRFISIGKPGGESATQKLRILLNWPRLVERLSGSGD